MIFHTHISFPPQAPFSVCDTGRPSSKPPIEVSTYEQLGALTWPPMSFHSRRTLPPLSLRTASIHPHQRPLDSCMTCASTWEHRAPQESLQARDPEPKGRGDRGERQRTSDLGQKLVRSWTTLDLSFNLDRPGPPREPRAPLHPCDQGQAH